MTGQSDAAADPGLSPSPDWYLGEGQFARERDTVWSRHWISVCRAEDVWSPGDTVSATIAGDPVLVVRGNDGQLRAFGNVCPHRSTQLVDGAGTYRALQCQYHAWTFRLDGSLFSCPGMEAGVVDPSTALPGLAVDEWQGWIFVNLDVDAKPVAEDLRQLDERLASFDLPSLRRAGEVAFDQPWNWKLTIENFAESYHHAAVHPTTLQREFPGQRSWVESVPDEPWIWLDHESRDPRIEPFAVVLIYPSHMFTVIRGLGMDWIRMETDGVNSTRAVNELFLPPELQGNIGLISSLMEATRKIGAEDGHVLAAVHKGLGSRWAKPGHVSRLERGCQEFRQWVNTATSTRLATSSGAENHA